MGLVVWICSVYPGSQGRESIYIYIYIHKHICMWEQPPVRYTFSKISDEHLVIVFSFASQRGSSKHKVWEAEAHFNIDLHKGPLKHKAWGAGGSFPY